MVLYVNRSTQKRLLLYLKRVRSVRVVEQIGQDSVESQGHILDRRDKKTEIFVIEYVLSRVLLYKLVYRA